MKTIKWLKISFVLQCIFTFFCISSTLCFAINRFFDIRFFFALGNILVYGWIINPTGILTLVLGMSFYFSEKCNEDFKIIIGKKWLWFIMFFVFDILVYLASSITMVVLTGGI